MRASMNIYTNAHTECKKTWRGKGSRYSYN